MLFWPIKLVFRLVSLLITAIVVYIVVSGVQVALASRVPTQTSALNPASSILLVGGTLTAGAPGPDLLSRLQEALACYKAHLGAKVVVTGAPPSPGASESAEQQWLVTNGVPASAIIVDPVADAATALGHLASVAPVSSGVIVVTDALSAYWTKSVATKDHLACQIAPATGSEKPAYNEIGPLWTQASAVAAGRIIGFSRASWAGH